MFAALALKLGVPQKLLAGGLIALLAAAILMLAYCKGEDAGGDQAARSRLEGNVKTLENKGKADAKAGDTRVTQEVRMEQERAELKEAIDEAPNPDAARAQYRRCVRLQQAARAANRPAPECP